MTSSTSVNIDKLWESYFSIENLNFDHLLELKKTIKGVIDDYSRLAASAADFGSLLQRFFGKGESFLSGNNSPMKFKLVGLSILDCLLDFSDDTSPNRRSDILRATKTKIFDWAKDAKSLDAIVPVIKCASELLGHFSRTISNTVEIGIIERDKDGILFYAMDGLFGKTEAVKYIAVQILLQLSINLPQTIFSKRSQVFVSIFWDTTGDRSMRIRTAAVDALEAALQVVSQRESLTEYVRTLFRKADSGFRSDATTEKVLGSLNLLDMLVRGVVTNISELQVMTRGMSVSEIIWKVLERKDTKEPEIKRKIMVLIPRLAAAFPLVFGVNSRYLTSPGVSMNSTQTYLHYTVKYFTEEIKQNKEQDVKASRESDVRFVRDGARALAYLSLGKLFVALVSQMRNASVVSEIYSTIHDGLCKEPFCVEALHCLGMAVNVSPLVRKYVNTELIDSMFRGGLSADLVENLKIITKHVTFVRSHVQNQLRLHAQEYLMRYCVLAEDLSMAHAATAGATPASNLAVISKVAPRPLDTSRRGGSHASFGPSTPAAVSSPMPAKNQPTAKQSSIWGKFSQFVGQTEAPTPSMTAAAISTQLVAQNIENQLILALQVLATTEFFPKLVREDFTSSIDVVDSSSTAATDITQINSEEQCLRLLGAVRDGVVRYLSDFNPIVRRTACMTCIGVLDILVAGVDIHSDNFFQIVQVMHRVLVLGAGDEDASMRLRIFTAIKPSLDHVIAQSESIHFVIESLNDENIDVREAATILLCRVAQHDPLSVMPMIRLNMKQLIRQLQDTRNRALKLESVRLLQAMVKGLHVLIVPYVSQLLEPLMTIINDTSGTVAGNALSTIGELAFASPESVQGHIKQLFQRLIAVLNDPSSIIKQETAVMTMGKLVPALTMATEEPYTMFPGLLEGLVRAIKSEESLELRHAAIRTAGLLGAVEEEVYQTHLRALSAIGDKNFSISQNYPEDDDDDSPNTAVSDHNNNSSASAKLSKMEKYYFIVVVQHLIRIIRDSSLSKYHIHAAKAITKIVKIAGSQASPLLQEIIDAIIYRLYNTEQTNNLRDSFISQMSWLVVTVGRRIRKYFQPIVKLIRDFLPTQLQRCIELIEALYKTMSAPDAQLGVSDFIHVLSGVLPTITDIIYEELYPGDTSRIRFLLSGEVVEGAQNVIAPMRYGDNGLRIKRELVQTERLMRLIARLSAGLGDYRKQFLAVLVNVLSNQTVSYGSRKVALVALLRVSIDGKIHDYASSVIHPLIRLLGSSAEPQLQGHVVSVISQLLCRLDVSFLPFVIPTRRKMGQIPSNIAQVEEYEQLVTRLLKQKPLPLEAAETIELLALVEEKPNADGIFSAQNQILQSPSEVVLVRTSLEAAWALTGGRNASDLNDWMRRLAVELVKQSPSPIIRMCEKMIDHESLLLDLLNASFYCIWDDQYLVGSSDIGAQFTVINGFEGALQSGLIPAHVLNTLLNLAEFMDMQDKQLPMNVNLLARQAQLANMFAKCLRYRETEFHSKNIKPSTECIDALITVNIELGLPERSIGVLNCIKTLGDVIQIQPLWFEKLNRWDEAITSYRNQNETWQNNFSTDVPPKHVEWMTGELGTLRCLDALGEYDQLVTGALKLKDQLRSAEQVEDHATWTDEVQRLGANAAWMLGKWDVMESLIENSDHIALPVLDKNNVVLEKNVGFYKTILAIHKQDYGYAMNMIHDTRNKMADGISALLSESYSRAYKAMVTMQILAELEEVVEFKQAVSHTVVDNSNGANSVRDHNMGSFTPAELNIRPEPTVGIDIKSRKMALLKKWRGRLRWAPRDVFVYRQILAVHTLVADPVEDLDSWLELVTMCRKEGMLSLCENVLRQLGAPLPNKNLAFTNPPSADEMMSPRRAGGNVKSNFRVTFDTHKYWWYSGEKVHALTELTNFLASFSVSTNVALGHVMYPENNEMKAFRMRCLLKKAEWMRELDDGTGSSLQEILRTISEARELDKDHYSVWHAWAVINYDQLKRADAQAATQKQQVQAHQTTPATTAAMRIGSPPPVVQRQINFLSPGQERRSTQVAVGAVGPKQPSTAALKGGAAAFANLRTGKTDMVTSFVEEAIKGFVKSIMCQNQPYSNVVQDILRLLNLFFSYGNRAAVMEILNVELDRLPSENWLGVLPQLIARMHVKHLEISRLLRKLLTKVASIHPQALVCPISVAMNTSLQQQKEAAREVLNEMRKRRTQLVEEATMVSQELMRVAISPHELWYDGIEKAVTYYAVEGNIPSMLTTLQSLHEAMLDFMADSTGTGPQHHHHHTEIDEGFSENVEKVGHAALRDIAFRHRYGRLLSDAFVWLQKYIVTHHVSDLHQAWEIYYSVFYKLKGQIETLKKLELHHISPALVNAIDLKLAVPGTYQANSTNICIAKFSQSIDVISSKQRPRKMAIMGSDGATYQFLLKGNEDLRLDERVMQLLGLINVCLKNDRSTSNRKLLIVRYSVLPLSNNSGLIGWVENCDTLNQLILQYRQNKGVKPGLELRMLQAKTSNYDLGFGKSAAKNSLPLIQKVAMFKEIQQETTGMDLSRMLWLKSRTADVWVERRANFTRSMAVMSMVGYILGLGDRHPSNLMLDRVTGRVVHIDFGDCFEITSHRPKFPEIIPFRLTRMLTNCIEQSGIEGPFKFTCQRVMSVLRDNRESVTAMLEAFAYDPLISWLFLKNDDLEGPKAAVSAGADGTMRSPPQSPMEILKDQMESLAMRSPVGGVDLISSTIIAAASLDGERLRLKERNDDEPDSDEHLNERALEIIDRIQAKLSGKDFGSVDDADGVLSVEAQVTRLIEEATSVENLCQLFWGWCPFW